MPTYKQDMTATSGNMGGDKKKKRKHKKAYAKSVSGGPKIMKKEVRDSFKPNKESAKQKRKNLLKENPVVNKSDDNENIGRGGKGPKPISKVRRAKASVMKLKDGLVSRFQSSTPKIGKNERLEQMAESLKPAIAKYHSAYATGFETREKKKPLKKK